MRNPGRVHADIYCWKTPSECSSVFLIFSWISHSSTFSRPSKILDWTVERRDIRIAITKIRIPMYLSAAGGARFGHTNGSWKHLERFRAGGHLTLSDHWPVNDVSLAAWCLPSAVSLSPQQSHRCRTGPVHNKTASNPDRLQRISGVPSI